MERVTLAGPHVRLEPLDERHRTGLAALADDPEIWRYSPVDTAGGPFARWFQIWFDRALQAEADGTDRGFVVHRAGSGEVVGTTRYLNIALPHQRVEIGHTWYGRTARGTNVNPACKRLLLAHAFETLGLQRVELKCDARNAASRAAIRKLGAREEGILRRHMVLGDGFTRDTVYHSILDSEWPAVKAALDRRLAAFGG